MDSIEMLAEKAKTGIWGLDNILSGGFTRGHLFLAEGAPGTGKTTVALQFLLEGARAGEKCLYITLSETERELRDGAASHGWTLEDGIEVFELLPPESLLDSEQQQSLLYSSDLELGETTKQVFEAVERVRPDRVVFAPSFTHSGHWNPTAAGRMQSGQMTRSQRWQRMCASRSGCR